MNSENIRGRHRAPGRHNSLYELKLLARESAQPAMKVGAVVAAAGGLVAAFANPASADTLSTVAAPAAVGPATAPAAAAPTALSKIGYAPAAQQVAAQRGAKTAPKVIEDVQVKTARQAAAAKAAAARKAAAAARQAAAARASRDLTRTTLTTSTSSTKSSSNAAVPSASSGMRSSYNWATAGQCTWGALNKWYQSEGYYPGGWTGNAMAWASGAAVRGLHRGQHAAYAFDHRHAARRRRLLERGPRRLGHGRQRQPGDDHRDERAGRRVQLQHAHRDPRSRGCSTSTRRDLTGST